MNERSEVLQQLSSVFAEHPSAASYIVGYLGAFLTTEQLQAALSSYLRHMAESHRLLSQLPE